MLKWKNLARSSFALFVALLLHLALFLLLYILVQNTPKKETPKKEEHKIKLSLKEIPKKQKDTGFLEKKVIQTPKAPPMPKGSQLKKITEQTPLHYEPTKQNKEPKLNPQVKQAQSSKETPPVTKTKKPFITLSEPKEQKNTKKDHNLTKDSKQKQQDPLYAMLSQDMNEKEKKKKSTQVMQGNSISQNIKELYGSTFRELSAGQQKYILDNQEIMRRITQEVLNRVAHVNLSANMNVNRHNVIEFYLHPNGDMSDFKFLHKSGYYILDKTTQETIEYAYSQYPRPEEKTLIRYNVYYQLGY